jgi:hypothetical protein
MAVLVLELSAENPTLVQRKKTSHYQLKASILRQIGQKETPDLVELSRQIRGFVY